MFSGLMADNTEENNTTSLPSEDKADLVPISITNYQQTFIPCFTDTGSLRIAIRQYECNLKPYFLAVNPYTLETECEPVVHYRHRRAVQGEPGYYARQEIDSTPYISALAQFTSSPYVLQNHGLTEAIHPVSGAFLTVDMCPSVKPFEASFFEQLLSYSPKEPMPVAICMTGLWMLGHQEEFDWLTDRQKEGKLKITWVNHSFSHVYYADLVSEETLGENFLLSPETNQEHEILYLEQLLIKKNQTPSVFFRAPGLVTDESLVNKLNRFGLIPLGSNAWLAKEEIPKDGSIILVHGNSNEPAGIAKAMKLLNEHRFKFFPIADAVTVNEKTPANDPASKIKIAFDHLGNL